MLTQSLYSDQYIIVNSREEIDRGGREEEKSKILLLTKYICFLLAEHFQMKKYDSLLLMH